MKSIVWFVFLCFFNVFALVVSEIHGFYSFSWFFNVFALVVVWELWRGLGISGKLPDALGDSGMLWGGSVRLVKGQMLSLNPQPLTLNPQPIYP